LIWKENVTTQIDPHGFRGSRAYIAQTRSTNNPIAYVATYYYTRQIDRLQLLEKLEEPGDFGIYYQAVDGKKVSRDLLDTIQELYFLDRHLGIFDRPELSILDIGAGYGRLGAHLANAYEGRLNYACTDAVALSSFLCEYYLRIRNVDGRVRMLPLDEVTEDAMRPDLAVNVHSFPECRVEAIGWWMDRLKDKGVPYLFVVPNPIDTAGKVLKNGAGEDFRSVIEERGYRLQACEPKYSDPAMQEHGLSPTHYYLFHREIDS
jgi:SAM-dependent methyltransferase